MATRSGDETAERAEHLAEQLSRQPDDAEALRQLLTLYEQRVAAETKPEHKPALWMELSSLLQRANHTLGTVTALERARALAPDDVRIAHALASALATHSANVDGPTRAVYLDRVADLLCDVAAALEPRDARRFLHAALGHAPWHSRALYALERATSEHERSSLAAFWVAYLAHNPDGDLARERRVALARAYIAAGQVEDAIFALEPAAAQGDLDAQALLATLRPKPAEPPPTAAKEIKAPPPPRPKSTPPARASRPTQNAGTEPTARGSRPPQSANAANAANAADDQPPARASRPTQNAGTEPTARGSRPPQNAGTEPTARGSRPPQSADAAGTQAPAQSPGAARRSSKPAPPKQPPAEALDERPQPSAAVDGAPFADAEPTRVSTESAQAALRAELNKAIASNDAAKAVKLARELYELDPDDDQAFDYLERALRRGRDHEQRAKLLLQAGTASAVPAAKRIRRLRDAVALFEQKLADVDGAVLGYQALLQLEPDSEEMLRGLARVLERGARWDAACECYERLLTLVREPAQQTSLLRRIADVQRRERNDRAGAASALARLIELDANDRAARIALTEDLALLERWDDLARLLERRVEEPGTKAERVTLLRQLAHLFAGPLSDVQAAFVAYERILELAPDDAEALARMEEIDEQAGEHERLLSTLARRVERAAPTQATQLLTRMAAIAETSLLDADRAHDYLRRALDASPQNAEVALALADLCERSGRYDEVLQLLRERAKKEKQSKPRRELLRRIARLLAERLHDHDAAAETYATLNTSEDDLEAWIFLEQHARERNQPEALCDALRKLDVLDAESPKRRDRRIEQAQLLADLGRHAEALEPLTRVLLEDDPDDALALERLEALCATLSDYRGLSRVLEELLASAPDSERPRRTQLARRLAELYSTQLKDERREQKALLAWTKATPGDPEPWRRLRGHYTGKQHERELLEALDELARLEPEAQDRSAALHAAAELCAKQLNDDAGALERVAAYARATSEPLPQTILDLARHAGGLAELCDICEETGRYTQLCDLLRERIELCVDPERKAELYRRLGAALIEHLQDEPAALAAYEGLLVLADDLDALHFVQAWASRHDDPKRLAEVLSRLARTETDVNERRDLWLERGRILRTRLGDPAGAVEAFEEALALDANFEPALDELLATSESASDNVRFARGLEHKLKLNPVQPLSLLTRLADLYEGPLADDARAVETLLRWVSLAPEDPTPRRRLRVHYKKQQRHQELLETLDALARCEETHEQRIAASVAAAEVAHAQLGDSAGAFARLAPLVPESDPGADRALLIVAERAGRLPELYELLESAGRYADLAFHLERAARQSREPAERVGYLRRVALVLQSHLNDVERTTAAYSELLTLEEDVSALHFMKARALEAGDMAQAADMLLRLSKQTEDESKLRELLFDYAHIQHFHLRASALAVPVLQRIVSELDPEFEPALDELARAAEAAGDDQATSFALERQLERATAPERRLALAERLAHLYEAQQDDDGSRAVHALQRWAELAPESCAPLQHLRKQYEKRGQLHELLQTLDKIAVQSESRDEAQEAAFAAARLCTGPLEDLSAGFHRYAELMRAGFVQAEDALQRLAFEHGRLDDLGRVYEELGRFDEACELLRKRAEAEPDVAKRADLWQRSARALAHQVGDEFGAVSAYRQVLGLREDVEALQYLRGVAERQDDLETLAEVLSQLARATRGAEHLAIELARALLLRDRLGAADQACELLRGLLSETSKTTSDFLLRDRIVTALQVTAEKIGDRAALALALEARLDTLREGSQRRTVALQLADVCEFELEEADRAAAALRVACSADPRHLQARRRLRAHLARQEAWHEYVALLDTLVHLEPSPVDRRDARLLAARCAHERLSDSVGALNRLAPLVQSADSEAEKLAEEVAKAANLGRELAAMYIVRARDATHTREAERSWLMVMTIQEEWLNDPSEAFEAALRLLAADTSNRQYLDHVDRLAAAASAWKRLGSIYSKLGRTAPDDAARIELYVRLSRFLEAHEQGAAALEFAMQAARLAPTDVALIERAGALAALQDSASDLFWAQEQRALAASDPGLAIDAWLDAARTADLKLRDREQANTCLRRALTLTERAADRAPQLLALAAELDAARPELGREDARRTLLRAHLELAEQASPEFRTQLVLGAARFATESLQDERTGFDVLRGGSALPPFSEALLDALEQTAVRIHRLDALDAQLARSADRTEAVADKQRLLTRRARVLTEQLARHDQAAQVYERLLELTPDDPVTAALHLECLRKAGRHRELLRACERRLTRVHEAEAKLALMREMATIWEVELKNRASALAIWSDVHALEPRDEEAARAVERLQRLDAP